MVAARKFLAGGRKDQAGGIRSGGVAWLALGVGEPWLRWRDRIVLTLPFVANFWRKAGIGRHYQTQYSQRGSGLALLPALDLAQRTTSNRWVFRIVCRDAGDAAEEGETLTASWRQRVVSASCGAVKGSQRAS